MDRPSLVEITDLTPGEADRRAHEQSEAAIEALRTVDVAGDEDAREYLRDLAEFVVIRER
jgi:geranylgeranyl diphosphate synthase type I